MQMWKQVNDSIRENFLELPESMMTEISIVIDSEFDVLPKYGEKKSVYSLLESNNLYLIMLLVISTSEGRLSDMFTDGVFYTGLLIVLALLFSDCKNWISKKARR